MQDSLLHQTEQDAELGYSSQLTSSVTGSDRSIILSSCREKNASPAGATITINQWLHRLKSSFATNLPSKKIEDSEIYYRSLQIKDRTVIQALHEEWFPVKYTDSFFDSVVRNKMSESGEPLFSCVACLPDNVDHDDINVTENAAASTCSECTGDTDWNRFVSSHGNNKLHNYFSLGDSSTENFFQEENNRWQVVQTHQQASIENGNVKTQSHVCIELLDDDQDAVHNDGWDVAALRCTEMSMRPPLQEPNKHHLQNNNRCQHYNSPTSKKDDRIVGCIVGSILSASSKREATSLLIRDPTRHSHMFYIMTLGTIQDFRNRGLGSKLVQRAIEHVENDLRVGALYLHVITYNETAIRFYERLGFRRVTEMEDYYNIDGVNYNCFLYARYFHGNRGHRSLIRVVTDFVACVFKRVTLPISSASYKVIEGG